MAKFNEKLYLVGMYNDPYFPNSLVDKVKAQLVEVVEYLESGNRSINDIQLKFDDMTDAINELQADFYEDDSEIETAARDSIGKTVEEILKHFNIRLDAEEAIRNREW
ncbi:hypothetical protein SAMN04487897_1714 [Paenibacillus sp. yr247]|uniref:DUF5713 family protein n=1 Tax=Paenibacillus sp. yr247 TaxID=1761880 RepID=UPI00088A4E9A|nr:DUF5713 family protein [Paenibacillus sp. yr247]SDP30103.1 hypothetical protein SAMN04487897_1714 [Paenibacillus sp. yr247]